MSDLIRIQSSKTIVITSGLQHDDLSEMSQQNIPDRLKINVEWPKYSILVEEGAHNYPAHIAEWPVVKALVADGIFTIGAADNSPAKDEDVAKVNELKNDKVRKIKEKANKSLDEIAEEK